MNIFSLCLLLFINAMSIGLVFPIFAPLFTQVPSPIITGQDATQWHNLLYTLILATPTVCMIFGAPFWGRLSDHLGRKLILIIGLVGLGFSFGLSAFGITLGSIVILFVSRAIAGFMDGSESIAQATIADLSVGKQKARNMAYATFAGTIGFIVGPVIGGFLAEPTLTGAWHYQIPFIVSLTLTVINIVALGYFLPNTFKAENLKVNFLELLSKGFVFIFDKRIRVLSLLLFILQCSLAAYFQITTLMLAEKFQYSSGQIGLFTTVLGAAFSGGIFFVIHALLERVPFVIMLRIGLVFMMIGVGLALGFIHSTLFAWLSVAPIMLGISMMYNVILVLTSNAVSDSEQGKAMGSGTSLKAFGWLVSGVLIGSLYPHVNIILTGMLGMILIGFIVSFSSEIKS